MNAQKLDLPTLSHDELEKAAEAAEEIASKLDDVKKAIEAAADFVESEWIEARLKNDPRVTALGKSLREWGWELETAADDNVQEFTTFWYTVVDAYSAADKARTQSAE